MADSGEVPRSPPSNPILASGLIRSSRGDWPSPPLAEARRGMATTNPLPVGIEVAGLGRWKAREL